MKTDQAPARTFYNQLVRFAQSASLSACVEFECVQLNWPCFEEWTAAQRAALFTRVIRTPETCAFYETIESKWAEWSRTRSEEDLAIAKERHPCKWEERALFGVDCFGKGTNFLVQNGYCSNAEENEDDFEPRDGTRSIDYEVAGAASSLRVRDISALDKAFLQAKQWRVSDYICMNGVNFEDVRKRVSHHLEVLEAPKNSVWHIPEIGGEAESDQGFSIFWLRKIVERMGFSEAETLIVMTDGSAKELFGGSGFFACLMDVYEDMDLEELRESHYGSQENDSTESVYFGGARAVARRTSIEHCELDAVHFMLCELSDYLSRSVTTTRAISISIDSKVVLEWIAGTVRKFDVLVHDKLKAIYKLMNELDPSITLIWSGVHAHNDEI